MSCLCNTKIIFELAPFFFSANQMVKDLNFAVNIVQTSVHSSILLSLKKCEEKALDLLF